MHRIGYSLVSHLESFPEYGFITVDPDDGICQTCNKPGPVVHIKKDQETILDICEGCTRQIALSFSWGNET